MSQRRTSERNKNKLEIQDGGHGKLSLAVGTNEINEAWDCELCEKVFQDEDSKLLECQFCTKHFCIKCLGKKQQEYEAITDSDCYWFCLSCVPKVEKNLKDEREIEERCEAFMAKFSDRIKTVEETLRRKCERKEVYEIVDRKLKEKEKQQTTTVEQMVKECVSKKVCEGASAHTSENTGDTIKLTVAEIEDRKVRRPNMVIHNLEESPSIIKDDRKKYDKSMIEKIIKTCKVSDEIKIDDDVVKIVRLGKVRADNRPRSLLVAFKDEGQKRVLFKNLNALRETQASEADDDYAELMKIKKAVIQHDMTATERVEEKERFIKAKELTEQSKEKGEAKFYKVRGPMGARKIVEYRGSKDRI